MQATPMTAATTGWTVKVQGSNDDATWQEIGRLDWQDNNGGGMTWMSHKTCKRVRVWVSRVSGTLTATLYGEP